MMIRKGAAVGEARRAARIEDAVKSVVRDYLPATMPSIQSLMVPETEAQ